MEYDFSGWATKNDLLCSDGRVIRKDAFKDNDGQTVPLVWNHQYNSPDNVLGHALLENRDDGVYAYCSFNDSESGQIAKTLVEHGDVSALSIFANKLKHQGANVIHGDIKEVSLVLAGANPGASIQSVVRHGEESDEEATIYTGEEISLWHSENSQTKQQEEKKTMSTPINTKPESEETVADVFNTLTEKQKNVVYAMIGQAIEDSKEESDEDEDSEGGTNEVKHNVFDQGNYQPDEVLSHSDQEGIISLAKTTGVGSLQEAISIYEQQNGATLTHGFEDGEIDQLFPDYSDVRPGAPELLTRDQGWVGAVMQKVHKSPISRIRTRQIDARERTLRGLGYKLKTDQKKELGNVKLLNRTTDPQTVYVKDKLHRDDIIDITDFDVVAYQYSLMRQMLNEELAMAIMVGDQREDGDENKISPEHIRPIYGDDDLYTIHVDVDIDAAKAELQGTGTEANFGENYIYAEAIINAALYAREKFKGSGTPDFYCTPHLLNVMLLARDRSGRRIYDNRSDLATALNVNAIYTAEQFDGIERTDRETKKHKLLGLFVNLADYSVGSTKGGEISRFNQFDIDFNQEKYLIETRVSGALTRVYSAIALEEKTGE